MSIPEVYSNDCSTRAILKIATREGYGGVNKRILDKYIMIMNKSIGDDYNSQASVDMIQSLCQKFGWEIDIVARIVNNNGTISFHKYPSPSKSMYWKPIAVIALDYNMATNSGHYEACRRDVYDAKETVISHGFSWGYL